MADGALVLMDAAEGPMPQTRFVLSKALEVGVKPIVVINKIDRPDARCDEVVEEALMLLCDLGGDHYMDHFDVIFASGRSGLCDARLETPGDSMVPLLDMMLKRSQGLMWNLMRLCRCSSPIWIGRLRRTNCDRTIQSGSMKKNQQIDIAKDGKVVPAQIANLQMFDKLGRVDATEAKAGDIVAVVGIESIEIGDTICNRGEVNALPRLTVTNQLWRGSSASTRRQWRAKMANT